MSLVDAAKLTVRQAARKAGISESLMRLEIQNGKVAVIRIGSKMMVLEVDLEVYLRGHYGLVNHIEERDFGPPRLPRHFAESELIKPKRRSA